MTDKIRNFVILAHIDHGKSTLADRLLELTGTIEKKKMRPQYLDMMDLERERGITIKMQPVRMKYKDYILNLIDTPGHVDFSYEVSRALAAAEGALLLVDATKGIQAQTIANLELAQKQGLVVIPVINKIDSPIAKVEQTEKEIVNLLKVNTCDILKISAKQGTNVEQILQKVVDKIPAPKGDSKNPLQALIFDSKYDVYKGVIAYVRIFEGEIKKGERIILIQGEIKGEAKELGVFKPEMASVEKLSAGEIGYIATGIKFPGKVKIGETISKSEIKPLPGYKTVKPMVFLSVFPENPDDFELLKNSLDKLRLNDAALSFNPDFKEGLGRGFQCGFLGLLHVEIVTERLRREFGLNLILSTPSVVYKVKKKDKKEILVYTSVDFPDPSEILESKELWAKLYVLTPQSYLGQVLEVLESIESEQVETNYSVGDKTELVYKVPLREIITKNLYDKLKSVSQGFGSMNYEVLDWRKAELVRMDILILGVREEAFSRIVPLKEAEKEGRRILEKLKENLPGQQFALPLQAAIGSNIIARETITARRKDVLAPLYGGDYTRKRKLLEKQKKGKKKLKQKGRIKIPSKVFLEVFKS